MPHKPEQFSESKDNLKRGVPTTPTLAYPQHPLYAARWIKIPHEVLYNTPIRKADFYVYCVLAGGRRGDVASIGTRYLAKLTGTDRRNLQAAIRRLIALGLIEKYTDDHRSRARYRLLSPAFATASEPGSTQTAPDPLRACVSCRRMVKRLGVQGWCMACIGRADLTVKVEESRKILGADATPEQIAAHLKNAKLAARIRRLMERAA